MADHLDTGRYVTFNKILGTNGFKRDCVFSADFSVENHESIIFTRLKKYSDLTFL